MPAVQQTAGAGAADAAVLPHPRERVQLRRVRLDLRCGDPRQAGRQGDRPLFAALRELENELAADPGHLAADDYLPRPEVEVFLGESEDASLPEAEPGRACRYGPVGLRVLVGHEPDP